MVHVKFGGRALIALGMLFLGGVPATADAQAYTATLVGSKATSAAAAPGAQKVLLAAEQLMARSPVTLTDTISQIIAANGGSAGVALVELGGSAPVTWSLNGGLVFTAASTYKLAALMMEAQDIAAGATDPNGLVCYQDSDHEDGWYDDYAEGMCYTRFELAQRAGLHSDNTAGHMLVRDLGGADALNAWAAAAGTMQSVFFTDNTTTADDLAALWSAEVHGKLGGAAAQAWLYPLLIGTSTEAGVPAGVAGRSVVVHKTGTIDLVENDAAFVESGPNGAYILIVMTDNLGGDAGWQLIASISGAVWGFEAARAT